MKTKTISYACSFFFLLNTYVVFSQAPFKTAALKNTIGFSPAAPGVTAHSPEVSINKKIEKYVTAHFAAMSGENWSMAGKNYHCRFYLNGIPATALFSKNGNLIYFVMHGFEEDMPSGIRKIVKREYFDYIITNAIEVKQNEEDIWIVKMRANSEHLTVRVEEGLMEVVEKFKEL